MTQNDYSKNITNGETGIVTAIDKVRDSITIEKSSGESVTLSIDEALHLDHGYASTVHAAQGATCERVMFDADTRSVMANEAQFYVAISRATDEVTVYTDDRTLLPDAMDAADLKEAALDLKPEREAAALDMT
ncbi:MAG: ATP-binding domain-containing protein [Betaproteobacteria bacterium]|nr:ATP-binding domain-containing protein [Betaproteobacteria bacterium]